MKLECKHLRLLSPLLKGWLINLAVVLLVVGFFFDVWWGLPVGALCCIATLALIITEERESRKTMRELENSK